MAERIGVTFQKGGVGKTFIATSVGGGLSARGYNVLLVDMDPQGSLSANLGKRELYMNAESVSLDEILLDVNDWDRVTEIIQTDHMEFDLIPANSTFSANRSPLDSASNGEKRLNRVMNRLDEKYDYIIFDCPPTLDSYTKNAILASKQLIIPLKAEYEMIHSTDLLLEMMEEFEVIHNISINYLAFYVNNIHQLIIIK